MKPPSPPPRRISLGHVLVPFGVLLSLLPGVPAGAALVAGASLALLIGNPWNAATRPLSRKLLSASVVGLGAGMQLGAVLSTGLHGALWTVLLITATLVFGALLAKAMGVGANTGLLISVGTAICGGSAIAAVSPVVRAEDEEVAIALATVFLLNAAALFLFPPVGRLAGLSGTDFGHWAALAIHDTSSVVGAALQYGDGALEVATTTKLARALWIVPLTLVLGRVVRSRDKNQDEGSRPKSAPPWFIAGFLGASALVTLVPALAPAGAVIAAIARRLLVASLFLIGVNLSRAALRATGVRPLIHGGILWAAVATTTLLAIRFG